jgi:hypothetical protein
VSQEPADQGLRAAERDEPAAAERTAPDATQALPAPQQGSAPPADRPALDDAARRDALLRSGAGEAPRPGYGAGPGGGAGAGAGALGAAAAAATAATTGAGAARADSGAGRSVSPDDRTAVHHTGQQAGQQSGRPERPRPDQRPGHARPAPGRPATRAPGRSRRARLVLQRVDPWSVFLFSLVASICLGIVLLVAVATLYLVLGNLGVLGSVNTVLGEVLGSAGPDDVAQPFFTAGRVLGATAVLAAVDVVLLTVLATLSALLYNLCASLTGGVEVVLGEREQ